MLFRPAESSKKIVTFYRDYLLTSFRTNKDYYNKQLEEELSRDGVLANGPFISMSDSFEKTESIADLISEGVLCKSMRLLSELKPERPLYRHQVEAIRHAATNKNLIITTGTGSGKTECFLIPVLNQLMQEKERGTLGPGIRTLIIYPMNALVNDQIRRLREIFAKYEDADITFGKFTGETEEKYDRARSAFIARENCEPRKNELICREQMRTSPPHILITNYAMLEYLLLRPGDNIFFAEQYTDCWKTIVLDEAHTYGGAKGIEVGSLLKRVKAMLGRNDIQFILTSATLGSREDNQKIVRFAQSLCNACFDSNSIVRSYTVPPERPDDIAPLDFSVYRTLATQIRDNYAPERTLKYLAKQGLGVVKCDKSEESLEKTLYSMIQHDSFYYDVRRVLLNRTLPLNQVAADLSVPVDDLTDFIAVASNAQLNGDKIFEARYHMFLRGMEGVFITLQPSNKLFVKKMETYRADPFDEESEYKVFEISFCHNCGAVFIVGQTEDGKLVQRSKFSDDYEPEVYLFDGEIEQEEIGDQDVTEAHDVTNSYLVCSKCGSIARASSLDGSPCRHGKRYYNRLIKVKEKGDYLHSCPCCHAVNTQRSIIRPYFLGNEAATAVIATALYDVLPNTKITKKVEILQDLFFGGGEIEKETEERTHLTKQFLTFSDNRQAAAFFASYLENTYTDNLIKRLMTQVSLDHKDMMSNGMPLEFFVARLEELMNRYKVGEEKDRHTLAWVYATKEIVNYKAKNSLQNLGVLFFDVDIDIPHGVFPNDSLPLSEENVIALFKTMTQYFMREAAIIPPVVLSDRDLQLLTHRPEIVGFSKDHTMRKYVQSWLPQEGKDNLRTQLISKLLPGKDPNYIRGLLNSIWAQLNNQGIIYFDSSKNKYFLSPKAIVVRSVDRLYICDECKTITPYYLGEICPTRNCNGAPKQYDFEKERRNNHYYHLFTELSIDALVAREHTAQLGSEKAYEYQNEFKQERINVLSCSTTFEMGVDVGSLETVFMRNMPPSPANYAQRAGRAGRSKKAAAYALTFCPNSSHDLNFFKNPVSMIKGTITPPAFNVNNDKIVLRHIFASAFSFFWKTYPELYKKHIGEFIDSNGVEELKKYLASHPEPLREYLGHVVGTELKATFGIGSFKWVEKLFSTDENQPGVFDIALGKYQTDLSELEEALSNAHITLGAYKPGTKDYNSILWRITSIGNSINTIKGQQLIAFLSSNNLIPKYGFPVDTVELKSLSTGKFYDKLRLDRDLFSAISEYAPESEVVADGKLIRSRYVRVLNGYAWPKYNYAQCQHCQTLNRTIYTEQLPKQCRSCGHDLPSFSKKYLIPKFGFLVENGEPKDVGTTKPERTFKGAISYIGDGTKIESYTYQICGKKVLVGSSKLDELAVLNTSPFYICESCGYGKLYEDGNDLAKQFSHFKPDGYKCSNDKLTAYSLGHEFQTDVIMLRFVSENITNLAVAWTILYSLLEGLSKFLLIDRNELSGCLTWYRNEEMGGLGNYGFVLFDNTPGGAGYVRQLRNIPTFCGMLQEGYRIVSECTCGGDAADTVCYECLCNYYNQKQHDMMQRRFAIEFFSSMLNGQKYYSGAQIEDGSDFANSSGTGKPALYNGDGLDQSSRSYAEIWEYIADDTVDEDELALFNTLKESTELNGCEKPFYEGSLTVAGDSIGVMADLIWPKKKIAFFLKENAAQYSIAKETSWKVFCMEEPFSADNLVVAIKG